MTKKLDDEDDVEEVDDEVVVGLVVEGEKQQSLRQQHRQPLRQSLKISSKLEESWFKFLVVRCIIFIAVLGSTWYCYCYDESCDSSGDCATTTEDDIMKAGYGDSTTSTLVIMNDDETKKKSSSTTTTATAEAEAAARTVADELTGYFTPNLTQELRAYWETLKLDNYVNSYQNQTIVRRSLQQSPLPSQQGDNFTPTRTCGQLISVTSLENAKQIAEMFLTVILPPDILSNNPSIVELAKSIVFGILQYGVATYKVCMSCQDVMNMNIDNLNLSNDDPLYGFQSYCSSSSPAYDVVSTRTYGNGRREYESCLLL